VNKRLLYGAGLLLLLSLVGNWLGFNQIRKEKRLHTETRSTMASYQQSLSSTVKSLTEAKKQLSNRSKYVKAPVIVPDPLKCPTCVRALLDGKGNAIYTETTETEAKEVSEALARSFAGMFSHSGSLSATASAILDDLDLETKPALKRWVFKVAQEFTFDGLTPKGSRQWIGGGIRQSVLMFEAETWVMGTGGAGMLGLSAAF